MPVLGSLCARFFVPRAPVGQHPLEDHEVPVLGSYCATHFVPGVLFGPRPLEHGQVPALCRVITEVVFKLLLQVPFDSAHRYLGHARHARRRVRPARPRDLPRCRGSLPAAGLAPAPAAAQLRYTRRNHRQSPAGTARATASRSSGGSPSAQGRPRGAPPGARGGPDPPPPAPTPRPRGPPPAPPATMTPKG